MTSQDWCIVRLGEQKAFFSQNLDRTQEQPMTLKYLALVFAASVAASPFAAPAAWYKWRSKLNGQEVCAQFMQGEWEKAGGPFKDAQCEKPGLPG